MKKLVFMFVAMAAVSFASCGGSENKAQSDSDSVAAPAVEEVASDSDSTATAADSNAVEAPAAETEAAAQ